MARIDKLQFSLDGSDVMRNTVFVVDYAIDISAAIVPVLDRSGFAVTPELFEVEVVNDQSFDVGIAFSRDGVTGKFDIGRREDSRLRIMDIGILDRGQISRASGDGYVHVVLDTPRLRAVTYA